MPKLTNRTHTLIKPTLLNLSKNKDQVFLNKLLESKKIQVIIDNYSEQLKELFEISNPALTHKTNFKANFQIFLKRLTAKQELKKYGTWVYYSWNCTLVHILPEQDFFAVRTARNKNLITQKEQDKFYNTTVGIAGLSVGNSAALAIILQGGARHIKLADHDRLALSNTNRIRTSITNLSLLKVEMTARQIYEINPYAKVEIYAKGLNKKNIRKFCSELDIIVDEVDNLAIKLLLRVCAKKGEIPLVMAADNGDNGIVDIERYDLNRNLKYFHGRLGKVDYKSLKKLSKLEIGRIITKHLGVENVTPRMHDSLLNIGKTLVSWPQLGGAALLNGSAVAFCVRKIANGQQLQDNRAIISLEQILDPTYFFQTQKNLRNKSSQAFKKTFNL